MHPGRPHVGRMMRHIYHSTPRKKGRRDWLIHHHCNSRDRLDQLRLAKASGGLLVYPVLSP